MLKAMVKTTVQAEALCLTTLTSIDRGRHGVRTPSVSAGKFIVLIDNSPTICKLVELALQRAGYEVLSFTDGIEAMRWFAGPHSRTPDLMLVEFDLPKLDGCDVIQKFKAKPRFAKTTCVLLYQGARAIHKLEKKTAGAIVSLPKPFTIQELLDTIQTNVANV